MPFNGQTSVCPENGILFSIKNNLSLDPLLKTEGTLMTNLQRLHRHMLHDSVVTGALWVQPDDGLEMSQGAEMQNTGNVEGREAAWGSAVVEYTHHFASIQSYSMSPPINMDSGLRMLVAHGRNSMRHAQHSKIIFKDDFTMETLGF